MILYGTGEPIEALQRIGRYVHSVHCKDATWAQRPARNGVRKCRSAKAPWAWKTTSARWPDSATTVR